MRASKLGYISGIAVLASIAVQAEAGIQTGSGLATFTTTNDSKDIVLSVGSPTWSADFSSYGAFIGDVHTLAGHRGASGVADVVHLSGGYSSGDSNSGPLGDAEGMTDFIMVSLDADGGSGYVAYKFVTGPGQVTGTGGTVSVDLFFRGQPNNSTGDNSFIGVATTLSPEGNLNSINNIADFKDLTMQTLFLHNSAYDSYFATDVQVGIPEGVSEFYFVVADDWGSGRLAVDRIEVNANVVPEPAALSLIGGAAMALLARRRR